jgi:hypothetical protein
MLGRVAIASFDVDPGGRAGDLHDVVPEGATGDHRTDEAEQALAPEHGHFRGTSVLHQGDERDDGVVRKVGVEKGLARLVENLASLQVHDLEMRLKMGEVVRVQCREEPVGAVVRRLQGLGHHGITLPVGGRTMARAAGVAGASACVGSPGTLCRSRTEHHPIRMRPWGMLPVRACGSFA